MNSLSAPRVRFHLPSFLCHFLSGGQGRPVVGKLLGANYFIFLCLLIYLMSSRLRHPTATWQMVYAPCLLSRERVLLSFFIAATKLFVNSSGIPVSPSFVLPISMMENSGGYFVELGNNWIRPELITYEQAVGILRFYTWIVREGN